MEVMALSCWGLNCVVLAMLVVGVVVVVVGVVLVVGVVEVVVVRGAVCNASDEDG